jgi:hypothetical protein
VQALLLYWQEDDDNRELVGAVHELAEVLEKHYQYVSETKMIPSSDNCKNSWRWLSRTVNNFVDNRDDRDVLKIVYYVGQSYLDGDREMVLAR